MKHDDGEHIDLIYDGMPDARFIKGHVSREEGLYVLELFGLNYEYYYSGGIFRGCDYRIIFGDPVQAYARWVPDPCDGVRMFLRTCKKGRGAFPVTYFPIVSRFRPVDCA